jgi:hypothetical protein
MEVWVNLLTAHRIGVNENMSYWRGFRQIQRTSRLDVVGVWSFTLQIWNFFVSEWEAEQIKASNFSIIVFTGRRFEHCCCQNSLFIYSSENFKLKIVDLAFSDKVLLDTFAEINQILLKIYFIRMLLSFMYLVTLYQKSEL